MSGNMENERIKNEVLGMLTNIIQEVDPRGVLDFLIEKRIINIEYKEKIMNKKTTNDRCRALLDHLLKCSHNEAFIVFMNALRNYYPWIADRINTDDENKGDDITAKVEQLAKDLEATKRKLEEANRRIEHLEDLQKIMDPTETELKEAERENEILNPELEQTIKSECLASEMEHLVKELDATKMKLQEANRRTEHLEKIMNSTETELNDARRETELLKDGNEIPKQELEHITTSKCLTSESSKRIESCLIVVGFKNDKEIDRDVIKININGTNVVSTIGQLPCRNNKESAATVYGNTVFVTGLGENCGEIWRFYARSSKWVYCNTMIRGRRKHCAAFVDHVLYICGGWAHNGGITLGDVEAYDTIDYRCRPTTAGKLVHPVHSSGNCVPFKCSLYIFGGWDADGKDVDYVQVYDTKLNSCTLIAKRMPVANSLLRAVLWGNKAILLGYRICLIYNIDEGTFQMSDKFRADVVHFGMIVHNGDLFVIGGGQKTLDVHGNKLWSFRDDVRSVPVANVLNDESIEWSHHTKLPKPTTADCSGKMEFLIQ